jgi:hypothetical protein
MNRIRRLGLFGMLSLCIAIGGCKRHSKLPPTYPAQGTVALDSKPLADGVITFISPETGDLQALDIKNGKFEGQIRPGTRRVEIRAYRPRKGPKKPLEPPLSNYLPKRYNAESTLSAEVTPSGPNTFKFELSSK